MTNQFTRRTALGLAAAGTLGAVTAGQIPLAHADSSSDAVEQAIGDMTNALGERMSTPPYFKGMTHSWAHSSFNVMGVDPYGWKLREGWWWDNTNTEAAIRFKNRWGWSDARWQMVLPWFVFADGDGTPVTSGDVPVMIWDMGLFFRVRATGRWITSYEGQPWTEGDYYPVLSDYTTGGSEFVRGDQPGEIKRAAGMAAHGWGHKVYLPSEAFDCVHARFRVRYPRPSSAVTVIDAGLDYYPDEGDFGGANVPAACASRPIQVPTDGSWRWVSCTSLIDRNVNMDAGSGITSDSFRQNPPPIWI